MSARASQQSFRCASRTITVPRRQGPPGIPGLAGALDHQLIEQAQPALERGEPVRIDTPIRNTNRTVGAMLSGRVARRYGNAGLPDDTIVIQAQGTGGQSLGAFGSP